MYYEILVNGTSLGVFGHENVRNLHLSVLVMPDGQDVFASAVCEEDGSLFHYDWLHHPVDKDDKVEIRRAKAGPSEAPRNKYRMRSVAKDAGSTAA
jgi:hypothetical protein